MQKKLLICGLGNPGKQYENTRHNSGFMVIDALRNHLNAPEFKEHTSFSSLVSEHENLLLVKPQTFMNRSGEALQKIAAYFHVPPTNIWVAYDDVDVPLGSLRIREEGKPGTHNGMRSVTEHLGTEKFPRFRIGIGPSKHQKGVEGKPRQDLHEFILDKISREEKPIFERMIQLTVEEIVQSLKEGIKEKTLHTG